MTLIELYWYVARLASGEMFLAVHDALIAAGEEAKHYLQRQLNGDKSAALMARVLIGLIDGNETYQSVLAFFDEQEKAKAGTVVGAPLPETIAIGLRDKFGDKVADLLALYVQKLSPIWPNWKTMGCLLYFGLIKSTVASEALIDVIATTQTEHHRTYAAEALAALKDLESMEAVERQLKTSKIAADALQTVLHRMKRPS